MAAADAAEVPERYSPEAPWHSLPLDRIVALLERSSDGSGAVAPHEALRSGLPASDVARRARELGHNAIPVADGPNVLRMLLGHFINAITVILGIVCVISAVFGDWGEFGVVLFVIIFNGLLGFYQEYGAEKSLQALKNMTAGVATVVRLVPSAPPATAASFSRPRNTAAAAAGNGSVTGGGVAAKGPSPNASLTGCAAAAAAAGLVAEVSVVPIDALVVGDLVVLEQGMSVPADLRLVDATTNLEIDEALLTGEALPVAKHTRVIDDPERRCALGDRKNLAFRSTLVTQGRGRGVVVAAGVRSEMGKLAQRLGSSGSGNGGSNKTPLQLKLERMMYFLFGCCLVLAVVVFAANGFVFREATLIYASAVAIAILPESLIAVVTVAMTVSVRRMAKQRCIVRKLAALEVLGNVTDICSDKTGTLTENKMVAKRIILCGSSSSSNDDGNNAASAEKSTNGADAEKSAAAAASVTSAAAASGRPPLRELRVAGLPYGAHGHFIERRDIAAAAAVTGDNGDGNAAAAADDGDDDDRIVDMHGGPAGCHTASPGALPAGLQFLQCAALCGVTELRRSAADPEKLEPSGNPTEVAIQVVAWKAGHNRRRWLLPECAAAERLQATTGSGGGGGSGGAWVLAQEFPFDSTVKRMSAVYRHAATGELYACTKGAPERVLELCTWRVVDDTPAAAAAGSHPSPSAAAAAAAAAAPAIGVAALSERDRAAILASVGAFAAEGLRTICLARRCGERAAPLVAPAAATTETETEKEKEKEKEEEEEAPLQLEREAVERELVFLGLVGIYDPPRPESLPSVRACQRAGIAVRMLTGDHTATAAAIAASLRIISPEQLAAQQQQMEGGNGGDESAAASAVVAGPDFDRLEPAAMDALAVDRLPLVVGRCSPDSKVRMIDALHRRGRVVAMTGDGFNDSPSINAADIGCAMGSGTDVTKGVADIVITDDNFATIVKAVAEGRRIAACINKFVVHLLSGNVAEVIALVVGLAVQYEGESVFVLSPIEILWLNLFTGSPPATGLSLDDADDETLRAPPNPHGFFTVELVADTLCYGLFLGGCTLASFVYAAYGPHGGGLSGHDCNSRHGVGCDVIWTARSTAFAVLYLGLLLHAYNVRSTRLSIFHIRWFDNHWLWGSVVFGLVTIVPILYVEPIATNIFVHQRLTWQWAIVGVALVVFLALAELYKFVKRRVCTPREAAVDTRSHSRHAHRSGSSASLRAPAAAAAGPTAAVAASAASAAAVGGHEPVAPPSHDPFAGSATDPGGHATRRRHSRSGAAFATAADDGDNANAHGEEGGGGGGDDDDEEYMRTVTLRHDQRSAVEIARAHLKSAAPPAHAAAF